MWSDIKAPVDDSQGGIGSLLDLKQGHPHLKVILSVGGPSANESFKSVASNPAYRETFAHTARGLVTASGLDGIDSKYQPQNGGDSNLAYHHSRLERPDRRITRKRLSVTYSMRATTTPPPTIRSNRGVAGRQRYPAIYRLPKCGAAP